MNIQWCTNCWTPSTRPRITFDKEGRCNACQWSEEKKKIDWNKRQDKLKKLCDKFRSKDGTPDVIVGWSGGKDSIYVAYKMQEFGMTPLLVTLIPALETEIGKWNRKYTCEEFEHVYIQYELKEYRKFSIEAFKEHGKPKHPFVTGISTALLQLAIKRDIRFLMFGEEGEQEYGGSKREEDRWSIDREYLMNFSYSGYDPSKYGGIWFLPKQKDLDALFATQWSRFEDWQPAMHGEFAIKKGMKTRPTRSIGTFTNYAQLSDKLQDLHAYMMFVKFGFGRCTSDVGIAIREGEMDRDDGLELIEAYDGEFPNQYLEEYCDYFKMTDKELMETINKFGNTEIMEHIDHIWYLKEWVVKFRRKETKQEVISPKRFLMDRII